ncbi:cupin domain-containing protein [Micromonospora sp. WMMD737]|uniref:cupin domain-containing protein n=1 Tax=Micromonospora sp. WMMD737 TaxID=3404113 RepID=UPI003B954868
MLYDSAGLTAPTPHNSTERASASMPLHKVRRIVTGHMPDGETTVIFDNTATEVLEVAGWPGAGVTELWSTDECPADLDQTHDRVRPMRHDPTPQGSLFRVVEIPPETGLAVDTDAAFEAMGTAHRPDAAAKSRHASMHRTDSVDYIVVIFGQMTMLMTDGTEVLLTPGDCVVQQGTTHAWVNRGSEPCVIAAVLIDGRRPAVLAQT